MALTKEEMQAILDAQETRAREEDPFQTVYGSDPRMGTGTDANMSVAPANMSVAEPNMSVAPAPAPAPAAAIPPAPAQSPTQILAKKALAATRGVPYTDADIDALANDPTAYNHFLSSDFARMNPNQQEAFNAQLGIGQAKRQEEEATKLNKTNLGNQEEKISEVEAAHKAGGIARDAARYEQEKEAKEQQHEAEALDIATKQAQAANEVVRNWHADPDRYWHNLGTGQKFLSVLGLILGSFAGATGGHGHGINPAVGILQEKINQDLALQEKELDAKKSAANQDQFLLGALRKATGDKQAARKMATAAYLQKFDDEITSMYEKATTDDQRRQLEVVKQELDAQLNKAHDEVVNHLVGTAETIKSNKQAAAAAAASKLQVKADKAREASIKEGDDAVKDGTLAPEKYDEFVANRFKMRMGADYAPVSRQAPSAERIATGKANGLRGPAFQVANRADTLLKSSDNLSKELHIDLDKPTSVWDPSDWSKVAKLSLGPDTSRKFRIGAEQVLNELGGLVAGGKEGEVQYKAVQELIHSGNIRDVLEGIRMGRQLAREKQKSVRELTGTGGGNTVDETVNERDDNE